MKGFGKGSVIAPFDARVARRDDEFAGRLEEIEVIGLSKRIAIVFFESPSLQIALRNTFR
jgi:hypothetical protein